jgi:hypothetical protein
MKQLERIALLICPKFSSHVEEKDIVPRIGPSDAFGGTRRVYSWQAERLSGTPGRRSLTSTTCSVAARGGRRPSPDSGPLHHLLHQPSNLRLPVTGSEAVRAGGRAVSGEPERVAASDAELRAVDTSSGREAL